MIDPLSVSAVTGFLGAVGSGMANETGRRLAETVGGLVARAAGREVPAPTRSGERDAVAGMLVALARHDPDRARTLAALMGSLPEQAAVGGPAPRLLRVPVRFF